MKWWPLKWINNHGWCKRQAKIMRINQWSYSWCKACIMNTEINGWI
jgi:hypothetical protein